MANIVTFTKQENGSFIGTVETLTFKTRATFEAQTKTSDRSPDYRITAGLAEIGAAWERTGKKGRYLSVTLDDPSFTAPINCRLIKTNVEDGFSLVWDRQKPAKTA